MFARPPAEDEEDDYMGDLGRFLDPQDLLPPRISPVDSQKGKSKLSWKEKKKLKEVKQQGAEDKQRAEGLQSAIPSSNIGFRMMQQMGYTPGVALGKHGQGSLEPINVDLKRSRSGLGRDDVEKQQKMLKSKLAEYQASLTLRKQEALKIDFHGRRKDSWQKRKIASDYRKGCVTLIELEERSGKEAEQDSRQPMEPGIKEKSTVGVGDQEQEGKSGGEDEEEEVTQEQLQELLERLRNQFFYCLYCGCQYESTESLLATCPGLAEDDH